MPDALKSVDVPSVHGVVVLNPDGTSIGSSTSGGNGAIVDGSNDTIKATVKDLTNSNPLTTAIVDANGDQITSFGGGVQYTEGDIDASITGTAVMVEDAANTLRPVPGDATKGMKVQITDGSGTQITSFGGGTQYTEGDVDTTFTGTIAMAEGPSNTATPLQVDSSSHLQVDIAATSADIVVQDGGGSLTVDNNGTFATQAAQSGTWNITNVSGTVSLPTGASTLTEQQTQTTALQLIDDTVATTAAAIPGKGLAISGTDGTNARVIKTDTSGELQVDVLTMPTTTVTGTVAATQSGTWSVRNQDGSGNSLASSTTTPAGTEQALIVRNIPSGTQDVSGTVTANLAAGTNNIGDVDILTIAAGDNNIGNVDIVTMPNVTLAAGTNTNEVVGDVAEDQPLAGNPVRVGVRASTAEPSSMSGDGDIVTPWADIKGRIMVAQKAATATLSNVAASATSVTILSANTSRIGATIVNDSSALLYIKFGTTASTTSYTVVLAGASSAPFSYYEVPAGYTGRIDGIWASATGNARVTEIT